MKNLIIVGVVGALIFGASFVGSTFLLQQKEEPETDDMTNVSTEPGTSHRKGQQAQKDPSSAGDQTMPVPFKPKTLTEESVLKMVESIQKREAAVITREKEVLNRESRHQFVLDDIQREKREYEAVVQQVQAKIEQAKRLLQTIEQKKMEIIAERKKIDLMQADMQKQSTPASIAEDNNIKKIAEWLNSMSPDDAALMFKEYANDGKLNLAAKILRQIEERSAAKILSALNDPVLVTQILDEFKNTTPAAKKLR